MQRLTNICPNYPPEIAKRRQWLIDRIKDVETDVQVTLSRKPLRLQDIGSAYEEYHQRTRPFYDELLRIEQMQTSLTAEFDQPNIGQSDIIPSL